MAQNPRMVHEEKTLKRSVKNGTTILSICDPQAVDEPFSPLVWLAAESAAAFHISPLKMIFFGGMQHAHS